MALRLPIKSTADLASIFNRQLRNTSVLSLEPGIIQGHVDVIALESIKIFRVKLNLSVAICADRIPGKTLISIDLLPANISNYLVARGISFQRPALFGFNNNLRDVDLVLPACSNMCVIAMPNHFLAISGLMPHHARAKVLGHFRIPWCHQPIPIFWWILLANRVMSWL